LNEIIAKRENVDLLQQTLNKILQMDSEQKIDVGILKHSLATSMLEHKKRTLTQPHAAFHQEKKVPAWYSKLKTVQY